MCHSISLQCTLLNERITCFQFLIAIPNKKHFVSCELAKVYTYFQELFKLHVPFPLMCILTMLNLWGHIHILSQIICLGDIKSLITFPLPRLKIGLDLSNSHRKCMTHYCHGHHSAQRDTKCSLGMKFNFKLVQQL